MERWYVVRSHPHHEVRAAHHLRAQNFTVYLPCYRRRRRHARRVEVVRAPLFPRYLFVQMDIERCQWRSINGTIGVHYLLSDNEHPIPVSDATIESIRTRENDDGLVVVSPAGLRQGQHVRIIEGPFADYSGIFDSASDDDRVALLLDLLGRQVRIKIAVDSVEVAH
jgi:transcriptional antiterminator RfaH